MEETRLRRADVIPTSYLLLLCAVLLPCLSELNASALGSPSDGAVGFTVGGDPACDFHTGELPHALQAAVDALAAAPGGAGPVTIVVARSGNYQAARIEIASGRHARGRILRGGFADCAATEADDVATLIDGDGDGSGAVFDIAGPAAARGNPIVLVDLAVAGNRAGSGIRIRSTEVEI